MEPALSLSLLLFTAFKLVAGQGLNILTEYQYLWHLCADGGPQTYVGVRYAGDNYRTYNYGVCYPYSINNGAQLAEMAVFCKSATCYDNPNPDCTGGVVPPVPVPIVAGLTLINIADWVQLLGQGATCQPNQLPGP